MQTTFETYRLINIVIHTIRRIYYRFKKYLPQTSHSEMLSNMFILYLAHNPIKKFTSQKDFTR